MSVRRATTRVPRAAPSSTIVRARRRADAVSLHDDAPLPTLTSRTRPSRSSASFFAMMEEAMSGMDGTVPEASRRA